MLNLSHQILFNVQVLLFAINKISQVCSDVMYSVCIMHVCAHMCVCPPSVFVRVQCVRQVCVSSVQEIHMLGDSPTFLILVIFIPPIQLVFLT